MRFIVRKAEEWRAQANDAIRELEDWDLGDEGDEDILRDAVMTAKTIKRAGMILQRMLESGRPRRSRCPKLLRRCIPWRGMKTSPQLEARHELP
jgi:hypothetical protein